MNGKSAAARPMSAAIWAQLLLLGAIWGGSFFFARVAVQEIPPFTLVLLRVAIAAAALPCSFINLQKVVGPTRRERKRRSQSTR